MRSERLGYHRRLQLMFAIVGNVVPLAIAIVSGRPHPLAFYLGAAGGCLVAPSLLCSPVDWQRRRILIALAGLFAITAMLANSGGAASPYVVLLMMPMVWFGLFAGDRDLGLMCAILAVCIFGPMLVLGAPAYPAVWGQGALLLIVSLSVAGAARAAARASTTVTDQLRQLAATDPLTGLLNRRGFGEAARRAVAESDRDDRPLTAAMLDLDGFKHLNDSAGHDAGDEILRSTAELLRDVLRAGDIVARTGGDEFVALLVNTDHASALAAFDRLTAAIPSGVGVSIGTAQRKRGESLANVLHRADSRLYEAKRTRDRHRRAASPPSEAPRAPAPDLAERPSEDLLALAVHSTAAGP